MRYERHSIDYIPLAERHGKVWHLWPVWFSGSAHLATLAAGAVGIALGGNFIGSALAVVFGCAFGTFFMAFHSTQGPQLGLPQMIQSRPQFGYMGALLVWGVALVAYIGFNAFNQVLAAQAVHQLAWFARMPEPVTIIFFALAAAFVAAVGYDWIHRAQRAVAYTMIAMLLVFALASAGGLHWTAHAMDLNRVTMVPFLAQLFAAASYQLSWSIYVSDYSRYLPRNVGVRASFWWTYVGAFLGGASMMLVGTVASALYPNLDIAAAMKTSADLALPGLGTGLMIGGLIGLIAISALNFYGASLTLLSIADSIRSIRYTVRNRLLSLLAALLASTGIALLASGHFVERFGDLLSVLLYLFTPWTAINLIDFYIVRKGRYSVREIFNPHGIYGRWSWRGLLAYAVGFAVMVPFFSTGLYRGPVARALDGADFSMLVGLPVAALVYLWTCRSLDVVGEQQKAREADLGLDAGSI